MSPFLIFYFLLRFAALIMEKSTKQYREELNNLMSKTIQQLKKIQMLAKNNPEFEFIDNEKLIEIDNALLHGNTNNLGEELFRNTKTYTNEHLHDVLDEQVKLIIAVQRLCIQNK